MSTWYRQGTISVTNGNATVTGIGTAWGAANTHPGDVLLAPDGKLYEILSIDSVTQLTIKPTFSNQTGYQGTTDTSGNAKYAIAPLVGSTTTADLAQRISAILTAWQDRQDELSNWQGGTVTGGDGNGYYPLTDSLGAVTHVMCPAKITALVGDLNNELIAAQGYATSAQSSATSAQTYASQAGTSATSAGNSASAASTSATNASNSATSASSSASTATTKASEASSSAASAASFASSASTSATNAASSAASAAASAVLAESLVNLDGDHGDISVSGSTWTIDANVVTLNKLTRTGTAGQVLISNGAGADPDYSDVKTINGVSIIGGGNIVINSAPPTDYGEIGTYVIAAEPEFTAGLERLPNVTVSGSSLYRSSITAQTHASGINGFPGNTEISNTAYTSLGLTGTWRRMTRSVNSSSTIFSALNLYVRIA